MDDHKERSPILIQGPMPSEIQQLIDSLQNVTERAMGQYKFWCGELKEPSYPVIISQTMKGMESTAAATALGISIFKPAVIIHQGTAGGHDPNLHVGDIVIGEKVVHLGSFLTPHLEEGGGSNSLDWCPMNLFASEESAGSDPKARTMMEVAGDPGLLQIAKKVASEQWKESKAVFGTIGASNIWDNEKDRISLLHSRYGTSVEDMETFSAAQVTGFVGDGKVAFLAIRVVSNNIMNGESHDPSTSKISQRFTDLVIHQIASQFLAK